MHPKDHFSTVSRLYASSRPRYPRSLFEWLARIAPSHERAWDCACGNGQATVDLASFFSHVVGTDLSTEQLRETAPHPRIEYRAALAESCGLPAACFDLVTVAQALHWFDCECFYAEARRVLRPGGVLAVWCYGTCTIADPRIDLAFRNFYHGDLAGFWHPERKLVESRYRTLSFPQPELEVPNFPMELEWNLEELLGYVRSWSATVQYVRTRGSDPVPGLRQTLLQSWGDASARHKLQWPLRVRAAAMP